VARCASTVVAVLCLGMPTGADEVDTPRENPSSQTVNLRYTLTMPADFDASERYPAVLALPPGPQNEAMVELAHNHYWDYGEQRGWIVVSPVAPDGRLFFDGSEALIPGLLDEVAEQLPIEAGRFHLAGISNGGISAFRIAIEDPGRFCSVLVFPGLPGTDRDFEGLVQLQGIPVHMYAGEGDARWVSRMRQTEERLRELKSPVAFTVFPGEGHVITESLSAQAVFDLLDAERAGCRKRPLRAGARSEPEANEVQSESPAKGGR